MGDKSAVAVFNLQVIDFFFLKALISAHVSHHGEITESHVIDIIYSYHACRDSTDNSSQKFKQDVMDLALKEDFPLLSLLT